MKYVKKEKVKRTKMYLGNKIKILTLLLLPNCLHQKNDLVPVWKRSCLWYSEVIVVRR